MNRHSLGERYGYVAIFVVVATFYLLILSATIGWEFDSRKSVAAFFTIPVSIGLLIVAASATRFDGRLTLIVATAAFGFVPAIAQAAWQRIETPIVLAARPAPTDGFLGFFIGAGAVFTLAAAAPWVAGIERGLDRLVRVVAPVLVVAEIAMFAVAIAHARKPDPDTFVASLPAPRSLALGERMRIDDKELRYVSDNTHREGCHVIDQAGVPYTDSYSCSPTTVEVTMDDATGMIMVKKGSAWSSSRALTPPEIAKRLAAPVGWTHCAGGGALLASVALLIAYIFIRRARAVVDASEPPPGGYRVAAPAPIDESASARLRDVYEARARGARFVALTVAASTALPLAAALAHGLGR